MKTLSGFVLFAAAAAMWTSLEAASAQTGSATAVPSVTPGARHAIPERFIPVDTRSLMGSPDPWPLEPVPAFPLTFTRPVELTHAGDGSGRLFVLEQQGVIRVFENRPDVDRASVFLDIQEVVSREGNEEGLLGLAFHPRYRENGELFVYYSTRPRASVLSRFRVSSEDPNRADRDSEEELMRIDQPYSNHNGGCIRFGPDGYLYIGLGDGGAADDPHSNGQNRATLLGSILRIDVDRRDQGLNYAIPPDNPFVGDRVARGEIWAFGLRNVWRMAFDRQTGQLWAGDVGQDRFEEVDIIQRGGNYGWNIREGFNPFEPVTPHKPADLINPVVEYHREDGESVTGGLVYRGSKLPEFQGAYFYGDFVSGNLWTVRWDGRQVTENRLVCRTGLEIAAFGEDQDGEMYLCAFDGRIYRMRRRNIDREAVAAAFPRLLSQTGLFASVKDNEPAAGVIPYEINIPFWSDFAVKDRYLALPENRSVGFHERDKWQFPVGAVFVKTFWMHRDRVSLADPLRLETRLVVRAPHGWEAYTYVYQDDQTEAHLLEGAMIKPVTVKTATGLVDQPYYFPSRSDCRACHTRAEGFVLGPTTRQMNHTLDYRGQSRNQIELLTSLQVFREPVQEDPEELERFPLWGFGNLDRSESPGHCESGLDLPEGDAEPLARAWLEVNCATCHRSDGIAPRSREMRHHVPLEKMNLVNRPPRQGQLSPPGSLLIKPGRPHESELFLRAGRRGVRQMPPLATYLVDPRGLETLRRWIDGMPGQ